MLLLGIAYAVFNSNPFQNWLTGKLGNYLSAQFKTKISIGHINYKPLQTFELTDVLFGDHKNDTLFFAGSIDFKLAGLELDSTRFKLNDVKVDRGYCNIKFYKDHSFNIDVLFNILDPNDTLPSVGPPFVLYFDKVKLTNTRFRFTNETDTTQWENFAANNEYFYNINATAESFFIIQDSLHFNLSHLDLEERSGFKAEHIQAVATISPHAMLFDSLELKTPFTKANGSFGMRYADYGSFSNFYDDVKLEARLLSSYVDMRDVAFFAAPFEAFPYRFKVQGQAKGSVSNLNLKNLDVRFGNMGQFRGKARLTGLPDIDQTFIDAEVTQLLVTKADIDYLAQQTLSESLTKLGLIRFDGTFTGFYKDFVAYGNFYSALGSAKTDLNMKLADNLADYTYSGNLNLQDFDLGELTELSWMGRLSAHATLDGQGFEFEKMRVKTNADIDFVELKGYRYSHITLDADLVHQAITADLKVADPNLMLDVVGSINLADDELEVRLDADLAKANLLPLHLDTMDLTINALADIDFNWRDLDHNKGYIHLKDVSIAKNEELYNINQFTVLASTTDNQRYLKLTSDNIKAEMSGDFKLLKLSDALKMAMHRLVPDYFKPPIQTPVNQQFKFTAQVKSLEPFNKLYFEGNEVVGTISTDFNNQTNKWSIYANLTDLEWANMRFRGLQVFHTHTDSTVLNISARRVLLNDTSFFRDVQFVNKLNGNQLTSLLWVKDTNSVLSTKTSAELNFYTNRFEVRFHKSPVKYKRAKFEINEGSKLVAESEGIVVNTLSLSRDNDQKIAINGWYSYKNQHQLKASLTQLKLNVLNDVFTELNMRINGLIDGDVSINHKNGNLVLSGDALTTDLALDNDTLGDFRLLSNYADNQNRLMAFVRSIKGKLRNLEVGGYYDFNHKADALNFNISFDESDISSFQAFVKDYLKFYSGNIRATGQIAGSLDRPEVSCNIDLMGVTLMVDYLKTMYSFSTNITLNEQRITLAPTEVRDINDQRAQLSGYISHKYFSQFSANLSLNQLRNFQLLNTRSKDNDLFYGTAYADGALSLTGPFTDLLIDAKFTAKKGTVINIPLATSYSDGDDGLIHFVSRDTLKKHDQQKRSGSLSGFAIKCMLHATRDAELNIVMDEQQGDKIRGRGEGDVLLELTRTGQFNMYGEVEVNEGDYAFSAMNLFTKKFTLKPGGKISWTGDPFAGQMNITGAYSVRTTVADVVSAATAEERETLRQQRVPVECLLYVKGNLLNPDIKFDMNITDISGSLPSNTISELQNTMRIWRNENDLMVQQVISILLFGRFTPTNVQNSTGPANLSAGVNNTLSGFVSAQATNFIQRIIPGFDLNIDYHTGSESVRGRQIVTGTKRVFDNRLEIQASFDPINTYQNFLTQYNLTRDGSFKAKAFSRAQLDPIYNRNINTNGVGLYYRKEFDSFGELFKFKSK